MIKFFFISFFIIIFKLKGSEILVGVNGLTKVGEECFINLTTKNSSKYNITELNLGFYTTDSSDNLLGNSRLSIFELKKFQPFTTSVPVNLSHNDNCKIIRNVDIFIDNCRFYREEKEICKETMSISRFKEQNERFIVRILNNKNFYNLTKAKEIYISEMNIYLKILDFNLANKYNIENYKNGLVVVRKELGSFLEEGDLIIEAETDSMFEINKLQNIIKKLLGKNENLILINLIRKNKKKLVAVNIE